MKANAIPFWPHRKMLSYILSNMMFFSKYNQVNDHQKWNLQNVSKNIHSSWSSVCPEKMLD